MIPASYLFKDVYRQHWLEPDPIPSEVVPPKNDDHFISGTLRRIRSALTFRLARQNARHVYE
ncbi:hypothetical protein WH87_16460 [Devosia epidermidihirudinis]|uniref:Uncharacterized protein n=1 Tax=Devosia epidermidihirudinis TaxID=1293439 RepID=A0A0F5Q4U3_9HYPH|nr:hypothetical protein [Devosia epidermidihirudinis]KKC35631.1 hypothetical protein WH87_16460 [Devosia epidermidihirudinis]